MRIVRDSLEETLHQDEALSTSQSQAIGLQLKKLVHIALNGDGEVSDIGESFGMYLRGAIRSELKGDDMALDEFCKGIIISLK